ncbi:MAG: hypothetical protein Q9191_000248 [Dirinaria sp. TL-2023a]
MSDTGPTPEQWPPIDLIAGLSLKTTADSESELDERVYSELPPGSKVIEITPSGASAWVQTVRIRTHQENGTSKDFFKKVQRGSVGRRMMLGTFASENAFYNFAPRNIPKPIAWGNYKSNEDMWFYLAEYHDMTDEVPDPQQFVSIIVKIHRESSGKSPTGKFGFEVPTHLANIPNDNEWEETWEKFFTKAMSRMLELEELAHGKDDQEFEELKEKLLTKIIPRLLRPLESDGRKVTPCLVHSDLWPGNCMPDVDTDEIMIFDSCAYWGHNESDLGSWRAPRYRMGKPFLKEYQKQMSMSYPEEDWDDRNALYAMRYDLLNSALFPNSKKFRNLAKDEMKRMSEKYPNGFNDFEKVTSEN